MSTMQRQAASSAPALAEIEVNLAAPETEVNFAAPEGKMLLSSGGAAVRATDEHLAAYFNLVRGSTVEEIERHLHAMTQAAAGDQSKIADLFALVFHTRDAREGRASELSD